MSALDRARLVISTPLTMYSPTVELIPLIRDLVAIIEGNGQECDGECGAWYCKQAGICAKMGA